MRIPRSRFGVVGLAAVPGFLACYDFACTASVSRMSARFLEANDRPVTVNEGDDLTGTFHAVPKSPS